MLKSSMKLCRIGESAEETAAESVSAGRECNGRVRVPIPHLEVVLLLPLGQRLRIDPLHLSQPRRELPSLLVQIRLLENACERDTNVELSVLRCGERRCGAVRLVSHRTSQTGPRSRRPSQRLPSRDPYPSSPSYLSSESGRKETPANGGITFRGWRGSSRVSELSGEMRRAKQPPATSRSPQRAIKRDA